MLGDGSKTPCIFYVYKFERPFNSFCKIILQSPLCDLYLHKIILGYWNLKTFKEIRNCLNQLAPAKYDETIHEKYSKYNVDDTEQCNRLCICPYCNS